MAELSIFVDESGDFGEAKVLPAYYLVSFVFHDQAKDITKMVDKLQRNVLDSGFSIEYIHTGPLIRREGVFADYTIDERRQLLYKILNFTSSCPIFCETIAINRKEARDAINLSGKISRQITEMLQSHEVFFRNFDKIIVYYDNGQHDLSVILNAVFSAHYSQVEFRSAAPQQYRLLQSADFVCTMELLKIKKREKRLSKSEQQFFYKSQELKKTFFKAVDKKKLSNNI